jgi:hypothetical protein
MSIKFSLEKAYEEMAQLQRMEQIENGNIKITISEGMIEYPVKAIIGARVQDGFPVELDFMINGVKQTITNIEGIRFNDQQMVDLIALFEYNMHNTIENGITTYTIIKKD